MIFVAIPYYHLDKDIIKFRTSIIAKYCGGLLRDGIIPMSPICFGTTVLDYCNLPSDFSFWDKLSIAYLNSAKEMHVLCVDGWVDSRGVNEEIIHAKELGIPIKYISVVIDYSCNGIVPNFKEVVE